MKKAKKTFYPKPSDITRVWVEVDATGQVLGRLAASVAAILRGKNKPSFTPGVDMGDFVVVKNAKDIIVKGNNKPKQKTYYRHSGYPGGLKSKTLLDLLRKNPSKAVELAVSGMLPHTKQGDKLRTKFRIYEGNDHPHVAQLVTKAENQTLIQPNKGE